MTVTQASCSHNHLVSGRLPGTTEKQTTRQLGRSVTLLPWIELDGLGQIYAHGPAFAWLRLGHVGDISPEWLAIRTSDSCAKR